MNTYGTILVGLVLLIPNLVVQAGSEVLPEVRITEIWTDNGNFGGCGAKISPPTTLATCFYKDYILFDCDRKVQTPSKTSANLFSAAQLGLATGNKTYVRVLDSKSINGICFADKVNVSNISW